MCVCMCSCTCMCECTNECVCAHANMSICVFACTRALVLVHVGVWVSACVYVHVAPCTGPLAMASLNISLTSNIICTVRLNKPPHTYTLRQRPTHINKPHQEKPRWHAHNGMTKLEQCPVNHSITKTHTHIGRVIWIHADMCCTQCLSHVGKKLVFCEASAYMHISVNVCIAFCVYCVWLSSCMWLS